MAQKGITTWFAKNTVAANLLAASIVMAGVFTLMGGSLRREVFPEIKPNIVTVTVAYPGATPNEAEEGVIKRIEEKVEGITGVDRVTAVAAEGGGSVTIETLLEADLDKVLDDVKSAVDGIVSFPDEIEEPVVQTIEVRKEVIKVTLSGDADEATLKTLGEIHRDRIADISGITQVELTSVRPYEIGIEVSEDALRERGLTFDAIAKAVRESSLDLPAGEIRADDRRSLIRTVGQAYTGADFEELVVQVRDDGTRVTLGEVATVVDGFAEEDLASWFDGEPGVVIKVFRVGNQDALDITQKIRDYVAAAEPTLPEGVSMTTWRDESIILQGRIDLLVKNALTGFVLVLVVLSLFLKLRLALWVTLGIPVSFLGAVSLMPFFDVSINMISLFAFLVVLGIVVDDAIVVGENVYKHHKDSKTPQEAAIKGAKEVALPVVFAVLTTIVAFLPMFNVPGTDAQIWRVIPLIVIPVLCFSLIESKMILPAHLSFVPLDRPDANRRPILPIRIWEKVQGGFSSAMEWVIQRVYRPFLGVCLRWRYATLAAGAGTLILTLALAVLGYVPFVFFPVVEGDNATALLEMPRGTPASTTTEVIRKIERAAKETQAEIDSEIGFSEDSRSIVEHMLTVVGSQPTRDEQARNGGDLTGGTQEGGYLAEINVQLQPAENRTVASATYLQRWRDKVGSIPGIEKLEFNTSLFSTGEDVNVELSHENMDVLVAAASQLKDELARFNGVVDISDSFRLGKQEVKLSIKPTAEVLGLTQQDLARQVRQAFYGEEAQRIQRGREDVKVMVRYPLDERRSLASLENMMIRTPTGQEVPFREVAQAEYGIGFSSISRANRKRVINVTAEVSDSDPSANAEQVNAALETTVLPQLVARHDGLEWAFEGDQKKQAETLGGLATGFLFALFLMYGLMAIPFKSYVQPLIVMSAIPFGLVGAVWGHALTGFQLSIMSMFGIIALSGVVVNGSLVLVDFINRKRERHDNLLTAVKEAGVHRFRPIILTSLTTFAGLTPLMLERSVQARFLIPMAISLAFGVMFATVVSLILVPCIYLVVEDLKHATARTTAAIRSLYRRPAPRQPSDPRPGDNDGPGGSNGGDPDPVPAVPRP